MSRKRLILYMASVLAAFSLGACGGGGDSGQTPQETARQEVQASAELPESTEETEKLHVKSAGFGAEAEKETRAETEAESEAETKAETEAETEAETVSETAAPEVFSLSEVPAWSGNPYTPVHGNQPYFTENDLTQESYETYAPLDRLGRCGQAAACVGTDLMPTEERGPIGQIKPTGWHTVKYEFVDGKYLYNRCHLIGYQLTAENANERNLITGTRYLNIRGMLPFENMTADYIKETGHHVLYRVTPIFEGDNLVASGVLMEGWSVEDAGEGICFCVYAYNVQPGAVIDYADGESHAENAENPVPAETEIPAAAQKETAAPVPAVTEAAPETVPPAPAQTYILNTNSKKFHLPTCSSVDQMSEKNKEVYNGSRDDLIAQGYAPCKRCNP